MNEIENLIQKAKKFHKSAELLYNNGDYDSCVSRCYYAMYFMVEALLIKNGLKAKSHKGAISLFGQHFIKTKILDYELGRSLRRAL